MAPRMTVTTRDLRRLVAIGDPGRLSEPGDPLPPSILHDLAQLVPCDDVIYQAHDANRQEVVDYQTMQPPEFEDAESNAWFWTHFWVWESGVPELTGNHNPVITDADISLTPAALDARAEYGRMIHVRYNAMVNLPPHGQISRRILLLRRDGRGFSAREKLLLELIRPHLAELVTAAPHPPPSPALTRRQRDVLRLIGAGFTNGQVARRLGIAEGTVRKHLENAYATLQVTNRVAALDRTRAADLQAAL
jgi:DNA-binding CsgD family transcriptional regulator